MRRATKTQWAAVVCSTLAVAWMLAPTFPMRWMGPPPASDGPTTWHSWADPLVLGYVFVPPLVLAAAVIAAVVGWIGVLRRRATFAPVASCAITVGLAVVLFLSAGVHVMTAAPVALVVASGVLSGHAALAVRAKPSAS